MGPPHLWGGGAKRRRGRIGDVQAAVLPIHGEVARSAGGADPSVVLPIHGEVARSAGVAVLLMTVPRVQVMDTVVALATRRGLIFPPSELYGGLPGLSDDGPCGTPLQRA